MDIFERTVCRGLYQWIIRVVCTAKQRTPTLKIQFHMIFHDDRPCEKRSRWYKHRAATGSIACRYCVVDGLCGDGFPIGYRSIGGDVIVLMKTKRLFSGYCGPS